MALAKKIIIFAHRQRHRKFGHFSFPGNRFVQSLRILPNLFTISNALCGFGSIICASCGNFKAAAVGILAGAFMDSLDGRIARYTNFTSNLGLQLDSLSDAVTFCLAPALLAYTWQLSNFGYIGFFACGAFLAAGLLRLARFNITHSQQTNSFIGTPTPIAGCLIAAFMLATHTSLLSSVSLTCFLILMPVLAGLMISTIPFPTFKHVAQHRYYALAILSWLALAIVADITHALLISLVAYFIFALEEHLRRNHCGFKR
jgi:CDP-diacylglycerol--serine O-phosphatidyltransferase